MTNAYVSDELVRKTAECDRLAQAGMAERMRGGGFRRRPAPFALQQLGPERLQLLLLLHCLAQRLAPPLHGVVEDHAEV